MRKKYAEIVNDIIPDKQAYEGDVYEPGDRVRVMDDMGADIPEAGKSGVVKSQKAGFDEALVQFDDGTEGIIIVDLLEKLAQNKKAQGTDNESAFLAMEDIGRAINEYQNNYSMNLSTEDGMVLDDMDEAAEKILESLRTEISGGGGWKGGR